jgi:protease-4
LVPDNSIVQLKLDYPITDRGGMEPDFMNFKFEFGRNPGLIDILENIDKAAKDKKIKGIYLDLSSLPVGIATIEEIRNALQKFKDESGKFIISYAEAYSQKAYYLASVSDTVIIHPEGNMMLKGLHTEITFFKNMLDKIDVEAQIIRHGTYKSAVEPFMMDHMSPANREQTVAFVGSIWNNIVEDISASRSISVKELNRLADNLLIRTPDDAVTYGLADAMMYEDEVFNLLAELTGRNADEKLELVSLKKYQDAIIPELLKKVPAHKIAVVFAQGSIVDGKGEINNIGSERVTKMIRKVRKDTTIKAIVLRVNSPGGSALASDVIWRETVLAAKQKPLVVSMGDVAASGGYYISCAADSVFASPTTITGSIGVFGVIPNMEGLLTNKIGLNFDEVKTNEHADFFGVNRPLTTFERQVIKSGIEKTYAAFTEKVSQGRNLPLERVDEIGQGRVWSGQDAKSIGLIDTFGGLTEAIEAAAQLAGVEGNYRLMRYPVEKEPLQVILDEIMGREPEARVAAELGPVYKYYQYFQEIRNMQGIQTRLPFLIDIE